MKYRLYEGFSESLEKTLLSERKITKKSSAMERLLIKASYFKNTPECMSEIIGHYQHVKDGRITVFPEDRLFFDHIKDARFSFSNSHMPHFPWECFSVAIPVGTEVDGTALASFRVRECFPLLDSYRSFLAVQGDSDELLKTYDRSSELMDSSTLANRDNLRKIMNKRHAGTRKRLIEKFIDNERSIEIAFGFNPRDKTKSLGIVSFFASDAKEILGLAPDEILNRDDFVRIEFDPEIDLASAGVIWSSVIRFVAGLSIHFAALGKDGYREGLPKSLKGLKAKNAGAYRAMVMPSFQSNPDNTNLRSVHIRQAHYRQLTASRYYQGDYDGKPIGSRWIKVKEALINASAITAKKSSM